MHNCMYIDLYACSYWLEIKTQKKLSNKSHFIASFNHMSYTY